VSLEVEAMIMLHDSELFNKWFARVLRKRLATGRVTAIKAGHCGFTAWQFGVVWNA
jgi:hypothetical protein